MCAQAFLKILDSRPPPVETKVKAASLEEVDIFAKLQACDLLSGVGEISRPRQWVIDVFSAALHGGVEAEPPYTAFLGPELHEAPWAPQEAARRRANKREKARQERSAARAALLNSAQPATHCLRCIIAGEVARAWQRFGVMGAARTHLAHKWKQLAVA